MTLVRTGLLICLVVFCSVSYLLVTGSSSLNYLLSETMGLPLGTPVTWLGLLSLSGILYFGFSALRAPGNQTQRILRSAWIISLLLAVVWPFISYYLAANWSNSFAGGQEAFRGSDRASEYFWLLTKTTAVFPLLVLAGLLLDRIFRNRRA